MLSGGQVAGLIVAMFWAILVCFLAVVLLRLARLLSETTKMIAEIGEHAAPLLTDMTRTVEQAGEQLDRVDTITRNMAGVTQNVSAVSTVVTSVVGNPLVKAAAFSYGVRRALGVRAGGPGGQVATGRVVRSPAPLPRRGAGNGSNGTNGTNGGAGGRAATAATAVKAAKAAKTGKTRKSGVGRK
jgi:uncharacterized protein YoxC